MKIIFMGTPEFAVASLDILVKNNYDIVAVVTVPDKPAGRGQQLQQSAVKKYALAHHLPVLQPEKLKAEEFLNKLTELKADLQIVVAFRMLPEVIWKMPPLGTFNLHGSLLPQYRGAAPINRAIMNGEKESGVTTFFIEQEIDTGKIIFYEKVAISENDTAGILHDTLMNIGAKLVLKTVQAIEQKNYPQVPQKDLIPPGSKLKEAPKNFKEDCEINWQLPLQTIHNHIRGLSPYPTAFTHFIAPDGKTWQVKIFISKTEQAAHSHPIGTLLSDGKTYLKIAVTGGYIQILDVQLAGKKRMPVTDFLRGFQLGEQWNVK